MFKKHNIECGYAQLCSLDYTAARGYDFSLRVVKTIFYERAQRVSKILFLTREDKSHIFKPPCIRVMFCLLFWVYIVPTPKQKIVKFHAQKQTGKSHLNMENISLCFLSIS
jgi:hypothetical protein